MHTQGNSQTQFNAFKIADVVNVNINKARMNYLMPLAFKKHFKCIYIQNTNTLF